MTPGMRNAQNKPDRLHKIASEKAEKHWGERGWAQLTPDMRNAYLCREALIILLAQADTSRFGDAQELIRRAIGGEGGAP